MSLDAKAMPIKPPAIAVNVGDVSDSDLTVMLTACSAAFETGAWSPTPAAMSDALSCTSDYIASMPVTK